MQEKVQKKYRATMIMKISWECQMLLFANCSLFIENKNRDPLIVAFFLNLFVQTNRQDGKFKSGIHVTKVLRTRTNTETPSGILLTLEPLN